MDKFEKLRSKKTNGINYELATEDIIAKLQEWDAKYGVEISGVDSDKLTLRFKKLPNNLDSLASEVYEFCPDTVDQGFGCYAELISTAEDMEQELPDHVLELAEGIDFEDESYGLEILKRSLKRDKKVALWWD